MTLVHMINSAYLAFFPLSCSAALDDQNFCLFRDLYRIVSANFFRDHYHRTMLVVLLNNNRDPVDRPLVALLNELHRNEVPAGSEKVDKVGNYPGSWCILVTEWVSCSALPMQKLKQV